MRLLPAILYSPYWLPAKLSRAIDRLGFVKLKGLLLWHRRKMSVACFGSLFPGISHSAGECVFPSFCVLLLLLTHRETLRCAFIVENLACFDDVYEIMMTDVNTVFSLKY